MPEICSIYARIPKPLKLRCPVSSLEKRPRRLFVVLRKYLLAQLDVLCLRLLLRGTSVDNLLPLVVLGLALRNCQPALIQHLMRMPIIGPNPPPSPRFQLCCLFRYSSSTPATLPVSPSNEFVQVYYCTVYEREREREPVESETSRRRRRRRRRRRCCGSVQKGYSGLYIT